MTENKTEEGIITKTDTFNYKYDGQDKEAYNVGLDSGTKFVVFKTTLHDKCVVGNKITAELKPPKQEGKDWVADNIIVLQAKEGETEAQPTSAPQQPNKLEGVFASVEKDLKHANAMAQKHKIPDATADEITRTMNTIYMDIRDWRKRTNTY